MAPATLRRRGGLTITWLEVDRVDERTPLLRRLQYLGHASSTAPGGATASKEQ